MLLSGKLSSECALFFLLCFKSLVFIINAETSVSLPLRFRYSDLKGFLKELLSSMFKVRLY